MDTCDRASTESNDELDWVARSLAGDELAAESLFERLLPIVQRRVASLLRRRFPGAHHPREEVEDLSQEILLDLFVGPRLLAGWRPERGLDLPRFVDMVTHRRTLSRLQSRSHQPTWATTDGAFEIADEAPNCQRRVFAARSLQALLDRLRCMLSDESWHLFELLFISEKSIKDAAEIMRMDPGAVYARVSRTRKIAREIQREI